MGTSNSYGGPGGNTPLIPTWLGGNDDSGEENGDGQGNEGQGDVVQDGGDPNQDAKTPRPTIIPTSPGPRYQNPRGNFTRFVRSGGSDRSALGRAVSGYVSGSMSGAKNASKRMGSSRGLAGGLVGFLNSVVSNGVAAALNERNLGHLVGKSPEDILLGIGNIICPLGGSIDEGIARNAYMETIIQLAVAGITDLSKLTAQQVLTVIQLFATNSIEARLYNDIGTKVCIAAENIPMVENVQQQLHDFISGAVSDALEKYSDEVATLMEDKAAQIVDDIYTEAFSILEILGEAEI